MPSSPTPARYRGRFAPSPTGPLHFGSLVAALGSYLDARAHGGEWLLRIEDVDEPRSVAGAAEAIMRTLTALGFEWDGKVVWQSQREHLYRAALTRLQMAGWVYPCACSRSQIAQNQAGQSIDGGLRYSGACRQGLPEGEVARAWRLRLPDQTIEFTDRIRGVCRQNPQKDIGDVVLLRADGLFAYQLAVVVDDAEQGINAIVRGVDILDSTVRQYCLQQCLGLPHPSYAHLPVVVNAQGEKISKQTHAPAINAAEGSRLLARALRFLGHAVSADKEEIPVREFLAWAITQWSIERVPKAKAMYPGTA